MHALKKSAGVHIIGESTVDSVEIQPRCTVMFRITFSPKEVGTSASCCCGGGVSVVIVAIVVGGRGR